MLADSKEAMFRVSSKLKKLLEFNKKKKRESFSFISFSCQLGL